MNSETMYSVGDIVTCDSKTNPLYKRESIVVYYDMSILALITEGLKDIFFCNVDDGFTKISAGQGLTAIQQEMLSSILENWEPATICKKFVELVEYEKKALGMDSEDRVLITLQASVPKKMATFWREFRATLELSKANNPEIPQDTQLLAMEWMLLSVLKVAPTVTIQAMFNRRRE